MDINLTHFMAKGLLKIIPSNLWSLLKLKNLFPPVFL